MRMSLSSCIELVTPAKKEKTLPAGGRNATVLAVATQKGGVGKTTTSVALASACARFHGLRVLLIDLDPQTNVNIALRDQVLAGGGALSDVLADPDSLEVEEVVTGTTIEGLFVTPADAGLLHAEDRLASRIGKELVLRKALEITRSHYDLIVLDCPPNVGTLTVNALVAADGVVVPANAEALAMAGVAGLMRTVHEVRSNLNPALDIAGVVLTQLDGRNSRSNSAILEMIGESWGDLLLPVQIGVSNALSRAQLEGQDIFDFDPGSRGAEQYRELAACLVERLEL